MGTPRMHKHTYMYVLYILYAYMVKLSDKVITTATISLHTLLPK